MQHQVNLFYTKYYMIEISTDNNRLDIDVIHSYLTNSYWGKGRTKQEVKTTLKNSLNFGVFIKGEQIGFARIVTDYIVFAYLLDVFILPNYRGKGYSKQLMNKIVNHSLLKKVETWFLMTKDAHRLYTQFGYTELPHPEKAMIRIVK